MPRQLSSSDLLITRIDGRNYMYIKPEIGGFTPTRTIKNVSYDGLQQYQNGQRIIINEGRTLVENADVSNQQNGISINGAASARIYDYTYLGAANSKGYEASIYRSPTSSGNVEVVRWYADGRDLSPGGNTDALDNNGAPGRGEVMYIRDFTAKDFLDASVDVKSDTLIMNATLGGARTGIKVWDAELTIVNSIVNADTYVIQLMHPNARVKYFNTKFNGDSTPDIAEVQAVGSFGVPSGNRYTHVTRLSSNPLPSVDDFFTIDDDRYYAQVSVNGGAWVNVALPSGGMLSSHVGDTLTPLPDLGQGTYRIRAWTADDGKTSAVATSSGYVLKNGALSGLGDAPGPVGTPPSTPAPTPAPTPTPTPTKPGTDPDVVTLPGMQTVSSGPASSRGGLKLSGGDRADLIVTTARSDEIFTGADNDAILFDTRKNIGNDVITDFNRSRDKLLFTEFVDLGADRVHKLDGAGRFVLDDPALGANGGTIALGSGLAGRFIHYEGKTAGGLHAYAIWNLPWDQIPSGGATTSAVVTTAASVASVTGPISAPQSTASAVVTLPGMQTVSSGPASSRGGLKLSGGDRADLIVTTARSDEIFTGADNDAILFDTRKNIGNDVITDFNRSRDTLLFTEFVDLGRDTVHKLDGAGRFVLDDPELGANGGTIALGSGLAGRYIHYAGQTADGLHAYTIWNLPWDQIPF